MEDHHVDRRHVEAQQCVKLSRTNRSIGLNAIQSHLLLSMPSEGIRLEAPKSFKIRKRDQFNQFKTTSAEKKLNKIKPSDEPLSSVGLVAQVRSAYTRSHPELGRETLQRQ